METPLTMIILILAALCVLLFWNAFLLGDMRDRVHSIEVRDKVHIENSKKLYSCLEQIAESLESLEQTALEVKQLALLTENQLNREGDFYDREDKDDFEGPLQ